MLIKEIIHQAVGKDTLGALSPRIYWRKHIKCSGKSLQPEISTPRIPVGRLVVPLHNGQQYFARISLAFASISGISLSVVKLLNFWNKQYICLSTSRLSRKLQEKNVCLDTWCNFKVRKPIKYYWWHCRWQWQVEENRCIIGNQCNLQQILIGCFMGEKLYSMLVNEHWIYYWGISWIFQTLHGVIEEERQKCNYRIWKRCYS